MVILQHYAFKQHFVLSEEILIWSCYSMQANLGILLLLIDKICSLIEPRHEKTCLCHMQTIKAQISLRIRAV